MTTSDEKHAILGIGNDIIEIERIRKSIDTYGLRLISRLFTTKEQDYCLKYKDPVPHFAGRFSAKEAVVKALGTGFDNSINWKDIEILNDTLGKPSIFLSDELNKRFNNPSLLLSMSHSHSFATAVVVWSR